MISGLLSRRLLVVSLVQIEIGVKDEIDSEGCELSVTLFYCLCGRVEVLSAVVLRRHRKVDRTRMRSFWVASQIVLRALSACTDEESVQRPQSAQTDGGHNKKETRIQQQQ